MRSECLSKAEVAESILAANRALQADTEEERQINDALCKQLESWFSSEHVIVSDAAQLCIERFVTSELDYLTDGSRGLGRMTDYWPRFGGRYRKAIKEASDSAIKQLHNAFTNQLLSGYFFAEYLLETSWEKEVPRDLFPDGSEGVFKRWVPMIYFKEGPPVFDAAFAKADADSYYGIKGVWGRATGNRIFSLFERMSIPVDDYACTLIRQFFDAGIMLRTTEMKRIPDEEHLSIVTAGAYSIPKQQGGNRSGCLAVLVLFGYGVYATAIKYY
jgi:hypothetical protein